MLGIAGVQSIDLVCTQVAGIRLCFLAEQVRAMRSCAQASAAAINMADFLGITDAQEVDGMMLLEVVLADAVVSLRLTVPPELYHCPSENLFPVPPLLACRCQIRGVAALFIQADCLGLVMDVSGVCLDQIV
jgi:hypothetical protein